MNRNILVLTTILSFFFQETKAQTRSQFVPYERGQIAMDAGASRGVAWGDFDQDGDPDLYVTNTDGQKNFFYLNDGKGGFQKIPNGSRLRMNVTSVGWNSQGVNWIDYDNDGDLDLFIVNRGAETSLLFRNDNLNQFTRITKGALVENPLSASMACWADVEGDGDLDVLFVGYRTNGNRIYKNLGNGEFEELKDHIMTEGTGSSRTCACGDENNDGLPEFFVGNARQPNFYYRNLANWKFEKVRASQMVTDVGYAYGASWADFDNDGDLDLFLANYDKVNYLFRNDGQGNFTTVSKGAIATEAGGASKGHAWGDYDLDGDLDLYIGNGTYKENMQNFMFWNDLNENFTREKMGLYVTHADTSAGVSTADFDLDGDLDLFVANWGGNNQLNRLYVNQTSGKNWLKVRLKGTKSNSFGIGSQVSVYYRLEEGQKRNHRWLYPVTGYASQNDYFLHFGLGQATVVDSVVVKWPTGSLQILQDVSPNTNMVIEEK